MGFFRGKTVFTDTPEAERPKERQLRGRRKLTPEVAAAEAQKSIPEGDEGIYWGGITLPTEAATQNFLFVGQIKSGKTVSLKHLMAQVLPNIGREANDLRALVYDAKGDMVSFLYALLSADGHPSPEKAIKILNPFDARCVAWNIARDVTEPAHVQTIASIIIPQDTGQNRFFSDAARQLLEGVIMAFILISRREKQGQLHWTLRDVCLALREEKTLKTLLSKYDETRHLTAYLDRTNNEVLATVKAYISPFEIVAAAWDGREKEGFSLREWRDDPQGTIIVLGRDPEAKASVEGINRVIFERLTQVILKGTETSKPRTWLFLDEFSKMGLLTGFDDLITNGRSKGAAIALAFQNIQGVKAVYGEEIADEIISECGSKVFLKCDGAVARWASEEIGKEVKTRTESSTQAGSGGASNAQFSRQETERQEEGQICFPSDFAALPIAGQRNGVEGYYYTSWIDGVWQHKQGWNENRFGEIAAFKSNEPDFKERTTKEDPSKKDENYQFLRAWRQKEGQAFGVTVELPPPSGEYLNSQGK
jgi:type IV secretory pathway TraG/TraD family ATPase VirD4